jgi:tRNA pseudouridine55 synthase
MARRKRHEEPGPSGFLVVDKPRGITSHDVVDAARRWLGTRRVGHLGTLDPQATGVLPLAIRESTKLVPFVEGGSKGYVGSIHLGARTDTLDGDGTVVERHDGPPPSLEEVTSAMATFRGDIEQTPPMYSAVKQGGVPLHKLARQGREVERPARKIHIERFALERYEPPRVQIEVTCSAGTYVRVLAAELGDRLGCGAYLESLRRTASGRFTLQQAVPMEQLEQDAEAGKLADRLIPEVEALGLPVFTLGEEESRRVVHGGDVPVGRSRFTEGPGLRVAGVDRHGRLLAVLELRADFRLQPLRVVRSLASSS